MKAKTIVEASDISELKSLGSYLDVKNHLEEELGNKLGVTSWKSFFEKIQDLKDIIANNKEYLLTICSQKTFKESKNEVSIILKLEMKSKNLTELNLKIKSTISIFCSAVFDPYEYYEETKFRKFQNSSKLEGIDIEIPDKNTTLESVLAKYKR